MVDIPISLVLAHGYSLKHKGIEGTGYLVNYIITYR